MEELNDQSTKTFKLEIENELRIKVGANPCTVELTNGLAEMFGTEMEIRKKYQIPSHTSIAIFTWQGCYIQITGIPEDTNVSGDTYMILNTVLHAYLEERRRKATAESTRGPITLVVGPTDVGKTTLCKFLLNYASRMGRRPIFVDLDVGQNSLSIPGTVGFCTIEKPADVVKGFENNATQVFQFGYKSPGHRIALYFLLLKKMGEVVQVGLRMARNDVKCSGMIINSCGWVRGRGYDAINYAAMVFEIDILCVLEEERLYSQLLRDMPSRVKVHFIPKAPGCVERTRPARAISRDLRIREYFHGLSNQLIPFTFEVNFAQIKVFKVTSQPVPDDLDSNITMNFINLVPVNLNLRLAGQVLALSSASAVTDDVMLTDVIGFICVRHVDIARGVITVLAPAPSPLPSSILLLGDMRMES